MVCVTVTRKCPMAFLHRQHLSVFQRLCADFRSCRGPLRPSCLPSPPTPPLSLVSLQNGPAQSRQIGTVSASQPASAGGSDCSQGHQALVRRVGAQSGLRCCRPALPLVSFLSSNQQKQGPLPYLGPFLAQMRPQWRCVEHWRQSEVCLVCDHGLPLWASVSP